MWPWLSFEERRNIERVLANYFGLHINVWPNTKDQRNKGEQTRLSLALLCPFVPWSLCVELQNDPYAQLQPI
jgi:hypothetical protein